jgi:O-Antigen ligase
MNNNAPAILKSAIIYLICVPLAVYLGYLLTDPLDLTTFRSAGVLALLLLMPILLRWHHLLLVFCWNMPVMLFFLPGKPGVVLPMIFLSFVIAILQRALSRDMRFMSVPALTWPMLFIAAVVYCTGKLTGGFGLRSLGSEVMGGKKYAFIFIAIMGYFALTSQRIPVRKAWLYVVLFFLPACLIAIGDLAGILPSAFNFLFQFFPANGFNLGAENDRMRLSGVMRLAETFSTLLLLKYGLRGIFLSGRLWRPAAYFACLFLSMAGGFRNSLISAVLLMGILFFLEGLQRTKLLPLSIAGGILALMIVIPFANKLPYGFQRTLSVLPMINVSAEARLNAEGSTEWRLQIWRAVLPEVPGYLLLGKGYALDQADMDYLGGNFKTIDAANYGSAVAGDYHSGPLSLVIPLGIWGVIGYLWMVIGGGRVLYNNYKYGDPALKTINTVVFAMFISQVIFFIFVVGAFSSDLLGYAGTFGLSVSLNGGMCRRPATAPVNVAARPGLQPFYPR